MQKTLASKSQFFQIVKRSMSQQNTFMATLNSDQNHSLRVMSTPTWPVPYYQRAFRHPTALDKVDGNILHVAVGLHNSDAMFAKEFLKLQGNGYVVEAVEQHSKGKTYLTSFDDS